MDILSLVFGVFSLALGIATGIRYQQIASQPEGVAADIPRVCYSEGQVFVDVREGAWYRLEDFVQPNDPLVRRVVRQLV